MRLADEFSAKNAYTKAVADIDPQDNEVYGAALAFQADEQTAGRGQHSNKWASPETGNCYVTFLLQCKTQPFYAPLVAALAVTDTLNLYLTEG